MSLNKEDKQFKLAYLPLFLWTFLFIVAPILILTYFAFTKASGEFTFLNVVRIVFYFKIILRSVIYAFFTTICCLVLAYPFAYFVFRFVKETNKKLVVALITLPTWTNLLLRTFAWMTILEKNGLINKFLKICHLPEIKLINTPVAVIMVMVYDFLPFMILPIYSAMTKIDKNLIEASADLGANEVQTFKHVVLPLSIKGVFQGIGLIFVLSCSTFIIPRLLSGGKTILIGDLIETQFMGPVYNPWQGCALALGLNLAIVLILLFTNKFQQTKKGVFKNETEIFL